MKCPHCLVEVHIGMQLQPLDADKEGFWHAAYSTCPACGRLIIYLGRLERALRVDASLDVQVDAAFTLARPKAAARASLSPEVPSDLARAYREACLVIADSSRPARH